MNNFQSQQLHFGYLDEYAKREVRRSILKAICIPGYQVPYSSREMPMGRGFGTGGLQLTLSIIGSEDILKVIDQGSDESVNAENIKGFIQQVCAGVSVTTDAEQASIIQTRHRIPEKHLTEGQVLVFQVPYPDSLVVVEASESTRRVMHSEFDYAKLWVKLYEDIVKFGEITISHRYPTQIDGRYVIDPSPIPRYDVMRLHQSPVLNIFGAGREKKIYAVPPYTDAEPLAFEDHKFRVEDFTDENGNPAACIVCGAEGVFFDEFYDEEGTKRYQCSDSDYCLTQLNR